MSLVVVLVLKKRRWRRSGFQILWLFGYDLVMFWPCFSYCLVLFQLLLGGFLGDFSGGLWWLWKGRKWGRLVVLNWWLQVVVWMAWRVWLVVFRRGFAGKNEEKGDGCVSFAVGVSFVCVY